MIQCIPPTSTPKPNLPLVAIVVIRIPIVALIRGLGSPTASKHSDLMKLITSGGRLFMCAFTLFFRIKPDRDLNTKINQAVAHADRE